MKKILLLNLLLLLSVLGYSQQFIKAGKIEFEVRVNAHRMFGDSPWSEMIKKSTPQFTTSYFNYSFNEKNSVYKFDRNADAAAARMGFGGESEDDIWYHDYESGTFTNYRSVFENNFLLNGELRKIDWVISPYETREIAGFNCRKATGIVFDSVYVFAYYTDEILSTGGPMGLNGLPGMILGVTIPRMYTSWIATKLENTYNAKDLTLPTKGKKTDYNTLRATAQRATKDWGTYGEQALWKAFL